MRIAPGLSFSLSRALGVASAKRRISLGTGVPLTKAGRQRKAGGLLFKVLGALLGRR